MAIQDDIIAAAAAAGINPPQLALELAIDESNLNQSAVGSAGEIGIFQLKPVTAASLGYNPYDPTQNIQAGCAYLAMMLAQFGDPVKAIAAYKAGPGTVQNAIDRYGANWFQYIPAVAQSHTASIFSNLNSKYTVNIAIPGSSGSQSGGQDTYVAGVAPTQAPSPWIWAIAIGGLAFLWLFF